MSSRLAQARNARSPNRDAILSAAFSSAPPPCGAPTTKKWGKQWRSSNRISAASIASSGPNRRNQRNREVPGHTNPNSAVRLSAEDAVDLLWPQTGILRALRRANARQNIPPRPPRIHWGLCAEPSFAQTGRRMAARKPPSWLAPSVRSPPWARAMSRAMASPSPTPPA